MNGMMNISCLESNYCPYQSCLICISNKVNYHRYDNSDISNFLYYLSSNGNCTLNIKRMITNQFIAPNQLLKPFVSNYLLATSHGQDLSFSSRWAASNEICFLFFLRDRLKHKNNHADASLTGKRNCCIGQLTHYNGILDFTGRYHTFVILFELNGINNLFGVPMSSFTNRIYSVEEVFGNKMKELHEQLFNAANIQQMAMYADKVLLFFLNQRTTKLSPQDCIAVIPRAFSNSTSLLTVEEYANMANMSIKSFERKFLEQAGMLPKLHMKLLRFNRAIRIKTISPRKSLTSVAYECGYFDQAHFIKDFKTFTGFSPRDFFNNDRNLTRPRIDLKQPSDFTLQQLSHQLPQEEFVLVQRTK
jgi:AraC-like DNA-binding protein